MVSFKKYDWKNYRWNSDSYSSSAAANAGYLLRSGLNIVGGVLGNVKSVVTGNGFTPIDLSTVETPASWTNNYLQFYIDPDSSATRSLGNQAGASTIKQMLDTGTSAVREWQFIANSAGVNTQGVEEFANSAVGALDDIVDDMPAIGSILSRMLSVAPAIISGENVILPDVYQGSDYGTSYQLNINLASPYGNKLAIYLNIIVPLLHLIALVAPRQGTANSAGSPFMVKVFYPGVFNVNLGMVESITITCPSNGDAYSTDMLPTEVNVQLSIRDLYSDLSLSKSTEPELFANNSSLIDFLATTCGLNLIEPQLSKKLDMKVNMLVSSFRDIPSNAMTQVTDFFERKFSGFGTL